LTNLHDKQSQTELTMEWIVIGLSVGLLAGGVGLQVRSIRIRNELRELRSYVEVFAEASIRVAQTLDGLMQGDVEPRRTNQSSRRYLINEARDGIRVGEDIPQLADRLGLSHDEVMLLRRMAA
jgi:hypothetical protein